MIVDRVLAGKEVEVSLEFKCVFTIGGSFSVARNSIDKLIEKILFADWILTLLGTCRKP